MHTTLLCSWKWYLINFIFTNYTLDFVEIVKILLEKDSDIYSKSYLQMDAYEVAKSTVVRSLFVEKGYNKQCFVENY